MAEVLERIIARKRNEVSATAALSGRPPKASRSLRCALSRPGARFIMEVKRKSPSGHIGRHCLDDAIAAYRGIADAVSVLIDGPDFGGSLDDLHAARARFDGPILAKEFVVDPRQVAQARAAGADAILAMMSVLDDPTAAAVLAEAREFGMDTLVEVHDEAELSRALALGAAIIGINNRDLRTLRVDLTTTVRLAPQVPRDVILVSESGIGNRQDVRRLSSSVDAFLVGSALMAADNIRLAARSLVYGPVKICGLTRCGDVALAATAGATHAGFIFHPASPRRIAVDDARLLVETARDSGLNCVGVFAGDDPLIAATASGLGLDAVQVHGPFDLALIDSLSGIDLIGVRSVNEGEVGPPLPQAGRTLFDSGQGGTGRPFDWSILESQPDLTRAFLAGGITPANARKAADTGAYGLDVSSGVETQPGIKDAAKIASLFDALRPAARGEA